MENSQRVKANLKPKHTMSLPLLPLNYMITEKLRRRQGEKVLKQEKIFQQRLSSSHLTVQAFLLPLGCQPRAVGCSLRDSPYTQAYSKPGFTGEQHQDDPSLWAFHTPSLESQKLFENYRLSGCICVIGILVRQNGQPTQKRTQRKETRRDIAVLKTCMHIYCSLQTKSLPMYVVRLSSSPSFNLGSGTAHHSHILFPNQTVFSL